MAQIPRSVCELYALKLQLKIKSQNKLDDANDTINKFVARLAEIKWGIASAVSSSAVTTLSTIATNVASSIASQASSTVQSAISSVVSAFLSVLVEPINAVYALAGIIQKKAIEVSNAESAEINNARNSMEIISNISNKWIDKGTPTEYSTAVAETIPHVELALENLETVHLSLLDEDGAYFDKPSYNKAIEQLANAIDKSAPSSEVDRMLDISNRLEDSTSDIFAKKSIEIKDKYKAERSAAAEVYKAKAINNTAQQVVAAEKYAYKLESINTDENFELTKALSNSRKDAILGLSSGIDDLADEFSADISILSSESGKMAKSIGVAYGLNKQKQAICNTLFFFESKFDKIIEAILSMMSNIADGAAKQAEKTIETARSMTDVSLDLLKEASTDSIDDSNVSAAAEATKLMSARSMLIGVNTLLGASINNDIVTLINSDEEATDMSNSFRNFISNLNDIPDWGGASGIWVRTPWKSTVSSYVAAGALAAKVAAKAVSAPEEVIDIVAQLDNTMSSIISHSDITKRTLKSWEAPRSNSTDYLMQLLERLDALDNLAMFGTMASVLKATGLIDPSEASMDSCEFAYSDLFDSDEMQMALIQDKANQETIVTTDPQLIEDQLRTLYEDNATFNNKAKSLLEGIGIDDLYTPPAQA